MRWNDTVSKRNVENMKHVIRVAQFEILKSKSYSWKPRWIFSISSICSRAIAIQVLATPLILRPVITLFSRGTGCSGKQVFRDVSLIYILWKYDLPLSVSICRPRTSGHPSKYWPSARLLDLGDRLVPDT